MQKHPLRALCLIQYKYFVIRVYTPGYPARPHPIPHDTTPINMKLINSISNLKVYVKLIRINDYEISC